MKRSCWLETANEDSKKYTKLVFEHKSFLEVDVLFRIKATILNPGYVGCTFLRSLILLISWDNYLSACDLEINKAYFRIDNGI